MTQHKYDPRVGKTGGAKPQVTVSGRPLPRQWHATQNIGGGFYVVLDASPADGWESVVESLRREFGTTKPKRTKKEEAIK